MEHPEHPDLMERLVYLDGESRDLGERVVLGVPMVCPESPVLLVLMERTVTPVCPAERAMLVGMECLVALVTEVLMECPVREVHPPW